MYADKVLNSTLVMFTFLFRIIQMYQPNESEILNDYYFFHFLAIMFYLIVRENKKLKKVSQNIIINEGNAL